MTSFRPLIALMLLSACNRPQEQQTTTNQPAPPPVNRSVTMAPSNAAENRAKLPEEPPLSEPKGAIDPKSAEAAGQVVQHYGALIEQHRSAEAATLWGDADSAAQFTLQLKRYPEVHLAVGKPGDMEGAAGSIYVTVPVVFYGKDQNDHEFRRSADAILRRVNDVPGSTEKQRRWHIERVDWKAAG